MASTELDVERASQWVRSVVAMTEPCSTSQAIPVNGTFGHVVFDIDVDGYRYLLIKTGKPERSIYSLSPREREIARMIAHGHQNKVIAAVLNISSWTVCTHVRQIFAKLDVNSRAAMVADAELSAREKLWFFAHVCVMPLDTYKQLLDPFNQADIEAAMFAQNHILSRNLATKFDALNTATSLTIAAVVLFFLLGIVYATASAR